MSAEPLGLPIHQIGQIIFHDHEAAVGWQTCLHGMVVHFHVFCITHGARGPAKDLDDACSQMALREYCKPCNKTITAERMAEMANQLKEDV